MSTDGTQPAIPGDAPGFFPATRWSRIVRARGAEDGPERHLALEELCRIYWKPVVDYLGALGCGQDAADVAQDFFVGFLKREGFSRADPEQGRLRALLKTSVRNHYFHWLRDRQALCRGGGTAQESLDDTNFLPRQPSQTMAESIYDREWALTVLERALRRLREYYVERNKEDLFTALKPILFQTGERISEVQASGLGLSLNAITVEQHRARRRFADWLREEVADTVAECTDLQDELAHLLKVLAEAGAEGHG